MRRCRLHHAGFGALASALLVLAFPVAAAAGGDPASAVSQYVEAIPTAGGSQAVGVGKESKAPLSASAKKALRSVEPAVAETLTKIATSSTYGAPASTPAKPVTKPGSKPVTRTGSPPVSGEDPSDKVPSDTIPGDTAAGLIVVDLDGSNVSVAKSSTVVGLIVALGAISLSMILAAVVGRRRDRPRPASAFD